MESVSTSRKVSVPPFHTLPERIKIQNETKSHITHTLKMPGVYDNGEPPVGPQVFAPKVEININD